MINREGLAESFVKQQFTMIATSSACSAFQLKCNSLTTQILNLHQQNFFCCSEHQSMPSAEHFEIHFWVDRIGTHQNLQLLPPADKLVHSPQYSIKCLQVACSYFPHPHHHTLHYTLTHLLWRDVPFFTHTVWGFAYLCTTQYCSCNYLHLCVILVVTYLL